MFLSLAQFEKRKWGIKKLFVRRVRDRVRDGKMAYISEIIEHKILKITLWSLCKNIISNLIFV